MKISHISVRNYRGLKEVDIDVDDFVCVIGENNAGKSSLLRAFHRFLDGKSLGESELYDQVEDVVITVKFSEITDNYLKVLTKEHRERIKTVIYDGKLTLVRRFQSGSSDLLCTRNLPKEERFRPNYVRDTLRGSGFNIQEWIEKNYPEIVIDEIKNATNQTKAQEVVDTYVDNELSEDDYEFIESPLPTGIANSITPLFPEPIYVEAVKDFSDEVKTRQNATFGKLLNLLLERIEPKLESIQDAFEDLHKMLNIIKKEDGSVEDGRLDEIRIIEKLVEKNLQETFLNSTVEFEIPRPELRDIFSNAKINIDDGVADGVNTKGDGMRRSIIFSLLRSYVELSKSFFPETEDENNNTESKYIFLFEEPELYLHPKAQRTLFDALNQISKQHQVIISTHSPFFFEPNHTGVFVKMIKKNLDHDLEKPYGQALSIDLSDMSLRDQFQIISFETSNTAFFADTVVLVEGDSDLLVYRHIARILNPNWNFQLGNISLIRIGGKTSIRRYKEFFQRFDTTICVITDLDILVKDFNQLNATRCNSLQSTIIQKVDIEGGITGDEGKSEIKNKRLQVLQDQSKTEILELKRGLLAELRKDNVFVLEKGAIEDYFPDDIETSSSKPEQALNYCEKIKTRDDVIKWCEEISYESEGEVKLEPELSLIFSSIFDSV